MGTTGKYCKYFYSLNCYPHLIAKCSIFRFLAVDFGAPGSESDAAIFAQSSFKKLMDSKKLSFPSNGVLGNKEVPHVIVGDEGFPLKSWLLRPYPASGTRDAVMNERERTYNYRLSRARRVVENTFGIWASKWRILHTPIDGDMDLIHMIIRVTMILHNFIMLHEGTDINEGRTDLEFEQAHNLRNLPRVSSNNYNDSAWNVRETFADYFISVEGSVPWQNAHVNRS